MGLFLAGCGSFQAYQPQTQQGNILQAHEVNQLQLGMSQQAVVNLLGEPVLNDVLSKNLWTYAYTKRHGHTTFKKDLVLHFKDGQLVKVDKDLKSKPVKEPKPIKEAKTKK